MINFYKSRGKLPQDANIIEVCEAYFDFYIESESFGDLELYAMSEIDSAELVEPTNGLIETPFGVTTIKSLSSGCKTVLTYLYLYKNNEDARPLVINAIECGYNALDVLFECMEKLGDNETIILVEYENGLFNCKDREYLVNGEDLITESILL